VSDDARKTKQLVGRIDRATLLLGQLHDELLAIKRGLEGSNPTGEIFQHFADAWLRRHHAKYEFSGGQDAKNITRLLKVFDVATLKVRISRYIADSDPFLVRQKHPFGNFVTRVNTYSTPNGSASSSSGSIAFDEPAEVVGCKHTPPCGSDSEHTRRRMEDMRR